MHRARVAAALAVVGLALGACTGGDGSDGSSPGSSDAKSISPKTLKGACSLLLGPGATYVDDSLAAGQKVAESNGASEDVDRASRLQDKVFELVAEGPKRLQDSAGMLVDYLDDPAAYATDGTLDPLVTDAVAEIKRICQD